MHKVVHIKVNMNEGLYYDIRHTEPAYEASKQKEVEESVLTTSIEICDDAVQLRHNIIKKKSTAFVMWQNHSLNRWTSYIIHCMTQKKNETERWQLCELCTRANYETMKEHIRET